jgi:hypothetical protein
MAQCAVPGCGTIHNDHTAGYNGKGGCSCVVVVKRDSRHVSATIMIIDIGAEGRFLSTN